MKSEQDVKFLSVSERSVQSEQQTPIAINEFDNTDTREFNSRPTWKQIESSNSSDEFDDFSQKKGLNFRLVWKIVRRNLLLIGGATTAAAAAAFFFSLNSPDSYEGNFRLLVEPITSEGKFSDPSVLSRDEQVASSITIDYPTLLQILQSPGLLSEIAKQIQTRYPEFSHNSLSEEIKNENLVIQRIGTDLSDFTKLVEVSYKGDDPEKVQFVLSELAKGYLKYSLEDRKTRIGSGVKFIEDQLPRLEQQVSVLQGQLQVLQQKYKLSDPQSEGAELSKQLREIQAQKLEAQRQLREQQTLYANLQQQLKLAPNEVVAASTLSEDPNYQELLKQLKQVESQIAVESARFSNENPVIQTLREKQKNLSALLQQEAGKIVGQNSGGRAANPQVLSFQNSLRQDLIKQMVATANQTQVLEVRNQAVTQTEAWLNQQVQQFPAITRRHNDLQRQLEIATKTLNQLLIQRETLRVEAAQKEIPWEIVSQPEVPRDAAGKPLPAPSDLPKKLAMGIVAGLALGLGGALLREKSRSVFPTTEDIQDAIAELPVLEVVAAKLNKQIGRSANISPLSETFSSLYTDIRFLAEPPIRAFAVCSAAVGDGKTTIALHLAQAAAIMGQRVLLVDTNLYQPQIHTRLNLPNSQGLSNILSENVEPQSLIQRSPEEDNLFVLTAGQAPNNSTKLLASAQMQQLCLQLQSSFDLVIYDTPNLVELADAKFLAAHTDGILMVVKVGKTQRSAVTQVLDQLHAYRLPVLAVVANRIEDSAISATSPPNRHQKNHRSSAKVAAEPSDFGPAVLAASQTENLV